MASLGLTKEQAAKHCVHWQACPNFSSLYGDGGELNVVTCLALLEKEAKK